MGGRKVKRVQTASAKPFQHGTGRQTILDDKMRVELTKQRHRLGRTVHVFRIHVSDVPTARQQREVRLRFVTEKFRSPNPRVPRRRLRGPDEQTGAAGHAKVQPLVALPHTRLRRDRKSDVGFRAHSQWEPAQAHPYHDQPPRSEIHSLNTFAPSPAVRQTKTSLADFFRPADFCTDRLRGWNVRSARFLLSAQN